MGLVLGWLMAPLVLAFVCCGTGLLAERAAGMKVPGALVPGVGLAATIVVVALPMSFDATAPLALPAVVAAAGAGLALGRPWSDERLRRSSPWPWLLALAALALYAAPSVLSGQGLVAGYVKLDDSVTWMATIDRALDHGRSVDVPAGSYQETLRGWLGGGYPLGSFVPLGVAGRLSGSDLVAVYQPTIAALAAILALGLYAVATSLLRARALAAAAALVAIQASLFFGYAQWGGIKEAGVAALLPVLAWLAVNSGRRPALLVVVAAAVLAALSANGAVWAGPALAIGAVVVWRRGLPAPLAVLGLAALLGVLLLPVLTTLEFVRQTTVGAAGSLGDPHELGNLGRPLPLWQGAGLWPVGDPRGEPASYGLAVMLAAGGAVVAMAGGVLAARRGRWALPALLFVTLLGTAVAVGAGSAWVDAKALAMCAPMLLLATAIVVGMGLESREAWPQAAAIVGATALVIGCAWSTSSVVRDVYVAPHERLSELRYLGRALAGRGPTLQLDFESYGNRWFLRDGAADGATDLRAGSVRMLDGRQAPALTTIDTDQIHQADVWRHRTLVRRLSPVASRPPGAYRLALQGRFWEAWRRGDRDRPPVGRLSLGSGLQPASAPGCRELRALARTPGARTLVAARRPPALVTEIAGPAVPPEWLSPSGTRPRTDGDAAVTLDVPTGGRWRAWVAGGVLGSLEVRLDGRPLGSVRHEIAHEGQWMRFGALELEAGRHTLTLRYRRGAPWRAGRGSPDGQLPLGPVALTPLSAERAQPTRSVAVADYRQLCDGAAYDWVEARA